MARTYRLDHFTKGTGASVAPVDDARQPSQERGLNTVSLPHERRRRPDRTPAGSTPLAPGHVRKKATGEIGRVKAVDPKAGTVTVHWLRGGATSTVALTSVTRR